MELHNNMLGILGSFGALFDLSDVKYHVIRNIQACPVLHHHCVVPRAILVLSTAGPEHTAERRGDREHRRLLHARGR